MLTMTKDPKTKLGKRLRAFRTRRKLTQVQAAALIKVSVRTIIGWELGQFEPSERSMLLIDLLCSDKLG